MKPLGKRPRLAAIITEYRKWSHAQHIIDRFLWGYGWNGRHHYPLADVVSMYVDQRPESDLSRDREERFPSLTSYDSIHDALTLGGNELAVDGVLLIAEHGRYPRNEKQQTLYPRYEFFQQITQIFRDSGRAVPVFNDKHLSWRWDWAVEMVETAKELDFAFMAGSSLPVTRRIPPVELPLGAEVEEAMCVGVGGIDGYDIHCLESIQCMVERRRGGETGAVAIQALQGDAVWDLMAKGSWADGGWDPRLFEACLCRSHTLSQAHERIYNHAYPSPAEMRQLVKEAPPVAYRVEYADGLKATMLLVEGLVHDITVAARLKGKEKPLSTLMYLHPRNLCNFFSPLCYAAEQMFLTGHPTYPVERTLLTTGLTEAGVESLHQGQKRLETPHLNVAYSPMDHSTFWSDA
jgi:hypothetical protein